MQLTKNGHNLNTIVDWYNYAKPKGENQWVDGRSAKEVAKAWLSGGVGGLPPEVANVLKTHPRFGDVLKWEGEPEAKLRFDNFRGEPRNSDLVIHATDHFGKYLIAVEAKADETYGMTVSKTLKAAKLRREKNENSKGVTRIEDLSQSFFGVGAEEDNNILELRYQLLTACAGAICEARRFKYTRVLMLVHEFVTDKTKDENHASNTRDLQAFLDRLNTSSPSTPKFTCDTIYGPIIGDNSTILTNEVELFVGKVTRNIR
jgi:hypothetical protein